MALPATLQKSLTATASIAVAELFSEGKSAANDPDEYPFAEISERLDGRTCPLCQAVDGMIVRVGSPEYQQWRQPSHINCRRVMAYISKDEAGVEADFEAPDADLIRKHGHYHVDPDKYAELRVPAEPSGRHFVVRRVKNPETGEVRTVLDWAPWHDQLPAAKRELVLKARATTDEGELTEQSSRDWGSRTPMIRSNSGRRPCWGCGIGLRGGSPRACRIGSRRVVRYACRALVKDAPSLKS